ncbi:MAG: transpeptidase family protein [Myxococcales bacterium]|nr:transpeptidase family protein [Myxococcales bacterium]
MARVKAEERERRSRDLRWRLAAVSAVFALGFAGVGLRVLRLQAKSPELLGRIAARQHTSDLKLEASRGGVIDRTGTKMAESIHTMSVFAHPRQVRASTSERRALAQVLDMKPKELDRRLEDQRPFVWLKRMASPEAAAKALALEIDGIGAEREQKRFYPGGALAGHLLGFVGIDGKGLEGLELFQDQVLAERDVRVRASRDGRRRLLYSLDAPEGLASPGMDLHLTVDATVQHVLERELTRAVESQQAVGASAVVLDPRTGAVLAMANWPTFNPNNISRARPASWRNRAVTDVFEPGSTIKPFVVAAAMAEGLGDLDTPMRCEEGSWRLGPGVLVRDTHAHDVLTWAEVLQVSSNICAAKIALDVGAARYHARLRAFGFGAPTGIDLPGEAAGLLRAASRWNRIDLGNVGFGQGLSVTTLQLAAAYGALANDGVLMRPYDVARILGPDGAVVSERGPQSLGRAVAAPIARRVLGALEAVVSDDGTAAAAALDGYRVAGKTGTAQKVDPATKTYGRGRIASFVGVVPADDPRLVIAVVIDEPKRSVYGGVVAAPVFRRVAAEALPYLGVAPSGPAAPAAPRRAPVLKLAHASPVQSTGSAAPPRRAADLARDADGRAMPNVQGLTARTALRVLEPYEVVPRIEGTGVVVRQRPEAGTPVERGEICDLQLSAEG